MHGPALKAEYSPARLIEVRGGDGRFGAADDRRTGEGIASQTQLGWAAASPFGQAGDEQPQASATASMVKRIVPRMWLMDVCCAFCATQFFPLTRENQTTHQTDAADLADQE